MIRERGAGVFLGSRGYALDFVANSGKITGTYELEVSLRLNYPASGKLVASCLLSVVLAGILPAQVQVAWTQTWDDPWNGDDRFARVVTDNLGNVYVCGSAGSIDGNDRSFVVVKYASDGSPLWDRTFNPTPVMDGATAIAVDPAYNVVVAGYTNGQGTTAGDFAVIKYSPGGDSLWARLINSGAGDCANAVAVDDTGNVYVAGELGAYPLLSFAVVKYSSSGSELWRNVYQAGPAPISRATAIALDPTGGVCATGAGIGTDWDILVIKYNPQGETLWTARYDGPAHGSDISYSLAVSPSGYVHVAGQSMPGNGNPDCLTLKLDPQGDTVWTRRYNGTDNGHDAANAVALDDAGNVYITGLSGGPGTQSDVITIKYRANGDWGWGARYNKSPTNGPEQGNAIALDDFGNTYVAGFGWGGNQNNDGICLRYDSTGRQRGLARFDQSQSEGYSSLAVDQSNKAICAGYTRSFGDEALVIKYEQITGIEESPESGSVGNPFSVATLVRGVLYLPEDSRLKPRATGRLLDATGRCAAELHPGMNDVSRLGAGVYFVHLAYGAKRGTSSVSRVVLAR